MSEIDAPEGVTFSVAVYVVSDTLGATAVIRIGEFKRLPSLQDDIDVMALVKGLPAAPDWRVMTRDEIVEYTKHEDNCS
jgi:hypothetical protein